MWIKKVEVWKHELNMKRLTVILNIQLYITECIVAMNI